MQINDTVINVLITAVTLTIYIITIGKIKYNEESKFQKFIISQLDNHKPILETEKEAPEIDLESVKKLAYLLGISIATLAIAAQLLPARPLGLFYPYMAPALTGGF